MIELPKPDFNNCLDWGISIDNTPKVYHPGLVEADFDEEDSLTDQM